MGKGDKKSKKGKRWRGSFGVSRNKAEIKARMKRSTSPRAAVATTVEVVEVKPKAKRTTRKKAESAE